MSKASARDEGLNFDPDFGKQGGLLPVIVQDSATLEVLMLGWANKDALATTLRLRKATFWSRSRQALWTKGETSGDFLLLDEVRIDCDQDTLLYLVSPAGDGACHTKDESGKARRSCFYRKIEGEAKPALKFL